MVETTRGSLPLDMAQSGSSPEAAGVMRSIASFTGQRDKCAFLLSILLDPGAPRSERGIALLSLLDDIDAIVDVLQPEELSQFRDLLVATVEVVSHGSPSLVTLFPDPGVSGEDSIEGTNVQRVVVPGGSRALVGRFQVTTPGHYVIASEITSDDGGEGTIELDGTIGRPTLDSAPLPRGHNRTVLLTVDLDQQAVGETLSVHLSNGSEQRPVFWYHSNVYRLSDSGGEKFSGQLGVALTARSSSGGRSVFDPVTREPLGLADIDRLNGLRGKFAGERIFIMGNGPSLNRTPLDLLEDEFVFGLNRISLLFDRISWRPTFFTAFDVRVVPDNREEFASLEIPYKFFSARYKEMLGEKDHHYWYHTKGHYQGFESCFEPTVVYTGFGGGGTIGVMAVELAFFMGFRDIYLIGTDVSYSIPKTVVQSGEDEFGDGVKLKLQSTEDDDPNHFDPRYFGAGKKWHNPNVRDMKIGFARAAAYIERRGGSLLNATVGGELDEVPRVDFDELF